jgi:hypothetical protein
METLLELFKKARIESSGTANYFPLGVLKTMVADLSECGDEDEVLESYKSKIKKLLSDENVFLKSNKINDFYQLLGEAHFYYQCKTKEIDLNRIIDGSTKGKTPDFGHELSNSIFEVKTLSVNNGQFRVGKELEEALDSSISIEEQLKSGKKLATSITEHQPYGDKPYKSKNGILGAVIDTLINKAKNNIKREQYPEGKKGFLVLNLCMLPPRNTSKSSLRPVYPETYAYKKDYTEVISGELWMTAFGKKGTYIFDHPEFEGKPTIQGVMTQNGILADKDFSFLGGIFFLVYSLEGKSKVYFLHLRTKEDEWHDEEELWELILKLADHRNDDDNTWGFRL